MLQYIWPRFTVTKGTITRLRKCMTMLCRFRCRFWVRIIYPNVSTVYIEQGQHDKVKEMNEKALHDA
jgi:hypothetical protein